MIDIIKEFFLHFGKKAYLILLLVAGALWFVIHTNTEPGDKVNVLGLFEYKKKQDDPTPVPELLAQLDLMISGTERSHITLLNERHSFMTKKIDEFIKNKWVPEFAVTYFGTKELQNIWDEVVKSNNKEDRLTLLTIVGPELQETINTKRRELIVPLEKYQNKMILQTQETYKRIRSILSSIVFYQLSGKQAIEYRSFHLKYSLTQNIDFSSMIEKTESINRNHVAFMSETESLISRLESGDIRIEDFVKKLESKGSQLLENKGNITKPSSGHSR